MKYKCLFFLVFLMGLSSCTEKIISEPENLISKDKMAIIYYDLAIVTAAKNTNNAVLKKYHIEGMDYIFTKHKIDSLQFVESDLYYASKPIIYKEIYEKTEALIKKDVDVLEEEKFMKRKQDSIIRIETAKKQDSLEQVLKVEN